MGWPGGWVKAPGSMGGIDAVDGGYTGLALEAKRESGTMATRIRPFLMFQNNDAEEAMSFYVSLFSDGKIVDVVTGSPSFAAGLAPATKLIAIGGHKWNEDAAKEVIVAAERTTQPIELIVESGDTVRTLRVDWHGGLAYPHLARNADQPDLLSRIIAAKSKAK